MKNTVQADKMKTWVQTVDVTFKNSSLVFHTLELAPLMPVDAEYDDSSSVKYYNNDRSIVWGEDGTITQTEYECGTVKVWYPRPTLEDAINYKNTDGGFFHFKSNGSVEAYCYDAPYYWSPIIYDAEPFKGFQQEFNEDYF
jgi:hypothetical protein